MDSLAGQQTGSTLGRGTVLAMALTCGIAAANLYYNQPMLADIARSFGASESAVGIIPTATQIGYAAGLMTIAPLGDRFERRRVILVLAGCVVLALLGAAAAPGLLALAAASLVIGLFATLVQQVVPMAAHLAPPERRGRVVGTVMGGLLIGNLTARVLAGAVADTLGWRAMFLIAGVFMAGTGVLVAAVYPTAPPTVRLSYPRLIASSWRILREERVLQIASATGALMFGGFSVFWSTLTLYLDSPAYRLGATAAGLFGLIGIAGALAAMVTGRIADRGHARRARGLALLACVLAFGVLGLLGDRLWGLALGVLLLDLGVQTGQIANQAAIYALRSDARSRITMVYVGLFFVGGAAGSAIGSLAWSTAGWPGVCLAGAAFPALALLVHLLGGRARPPAQ